MHAVVCCVVQYDHHPDDGVDRLFVTDVVLDSDLMTVCMTVRVSTTLT